MASETTRVEADLLGEVRVPSHASYGPQTQRAVENFPVRGWKTVGDYPHLVRALLRTKQAAALANGDAGYLAAEHATAIVAAAERVLIEPQREYFPIHALHGGGGTSANMNANEVLANLGNELLGGATGDYLPLHPNDHVNLHQSTNDVYPTACHLAVLGAWDELDATLAALSARLADLANRWRDEPRLARTCLQDAVAVTFGQFLGGYVHLVDRARRRAGAAVADLQRVNLGGTIVGRTEDAPGSYRERVIPALQRVTSRPELRPAEDAFDAAQNLDDLVAVSGALDLVGRSLSKIAQDLRLLGSGPEAGLGELRLPAVQPGSSIMPGKVNPVIPEFVIQVGFQVAGQYTACVMALDHGELDLNVWESVVVFNVLDAIDLLVGAVTALDRRCLEGLEIDREVNHRHAGALSAVLTEFGRIHGYSAATRLLREAGGDRQRIQELLDRQAASAD